MKKIITLIILIGVLFANSYDKSFYKLPKKSQMYVKEFNEELSISQQQTIYWAYKTGELYDLKWTLSAIAWKESFGGLVKVNLFDGKYGSCGIFMNNLETVLTTSNIKITKWNLNKICTQLVDNPEYSLIEATKVIRHYQKYCHNNWLCIWAHYNGGYAHPNYKYAKDIWYRIQAIKYLFKRDNNE